MASDETTILRTCVASPNGTHHDSVQCPSVYLVEKHQSVTDTRTVGAELKFYPFKFILKILHFNLTVNNRTSLN